MISNETVIAANRFGLGARPGDLAHIGAEYRDWLLSQVGAGNGSEPLPAAVSGLTSSREILTEFEALRQERRITRERLDAGNVEAEDLQKFAQGMGALLRPHYIGQVGARYEIAVTTDTPFHERLVHFWTNHFAVSIDKPPVTGLAGTLENEAIRPHVTANFADMLLAVEQHPAMILYLDNQASIGPNSRAASFMKRRGNNGRVANINENLGREILELHTLGVDGGYTQADVTTFSKVITGWSVGGDPGGRRRRMFDGDANTGEFAFRAAIHEPGAKTVLGKAYADEGVGQGEAVLRNLATHPATARHLATKLARHFIADAPDAATVERIAAAYLDGDGHLPAVYAALVDAAFDDGAAALQAKYKTPEDYMVSAIRALGVVPERSRQYIGSLTLMGQQPYKPGSPAGWPDTTADWDGADALMKRIEWAQALGDRTGPAFEPLHVAEDCLGPALGEHSSTAIRRAESKSQGLAMLLMSPEFQRR